MSNYVKKQLGLLQLKIQVLESESAKAQHNSKRNFLHSQIKKEQSKTARILKNTLNLQNNKIAQNIQTKNTQNAPNIQPTVTLDFLNAKYQGKLHISDKQKNKPIKQGPGILLDDQMNFIVTNWKKNQPNGKTVLINRFGNYIYGKWNPQLNGPVGQVIIKVNDFIIVTNFSVLNGKWCLSQKQKNMPLIVIDKKRYSVLVLQGQVTQSHNQYVCSKTRPLSVLQFTLLEGDVQTALTQRNITQNTNTLGHCFQEKRNLQCIIRNFAFKYNLNLQSYQLCINDYLRIISSELNNIYLASQQFAIKVSQSLIHSLFKRQKQNKEQFVKYRQQKQKISQSNCIVYQQITNKIKNKKQTFNYFGFLNGMGIKFTQQNKQSTIRNNQKTFNIKSMGNHNNQFKIQDFGIKYFQNKCIQQGNFKSKQSLTYQNSIFRPTNKLSTIYKKYHKKQLNYCDTYFDKNQCQPYKILTIFQKFIEEHVMYIMDECFSQTTKFQFRVETDELSEKLKRPQTRHHKSYVSPSVIKHNLSQTNKISALKNHAKQIKLQKFKLQFQDKLREQNKPQYQILIQRKIPNKIVNQKQAKQPLAQLKNKKQQLNKRIKKVKYQIQYQTLAQGEDTIILTDGKVISKIKKHLQNQNQNIKKLFSPLKKSLNSKSVHNYSYNNKSIKQKTSYIQKRKSLNDKQKSFLQDSLQQILFQKPNQNYFKSSPKKQYSPSRQKRRSPRRQLIKKSPQQTLLEKINDSVIFKQKFNYGIQYHINNASLNGNMTNRRDGKQKNKYNGRERIYTDYQLDEAIDKHLILSQQLNPKSLTPGRKIKTKDKFNNYMYSNKIKRQNDQQSKLKIQKQTQDAIRAQILGISVEQYQNRQNYRRQKQKFIEESLFTILQNQPSNIYRLAADIDDHVTKEINHNQTFGKEDRQNTIRQSSIRKIDNSMRSSFSRSKTYQLSKYVDHVSQFHKDQIIPNAILKPRVRQQSLVEKRMRILQQFRQINQKSKEKDEFERNQNPSRNSSTIRDQRLLKSQMMRKKADNFIKPSEIQRFQNIIKYQKLPVYRQKQPHDRTILSPFKNQISQLDRNSQNISVRKQNIQRRLRNERQLSLVNRTNTDSLYRKSVENIHRYSGHTKDLNKYSLNEQENYFNKRGLAMNNKTPKKYQYFFDK